MLTRNQVPFSCLGSPSSESEVAESSRFCFGSYAPLRDDEGLAREQISAGSTFARLRA